MSHTILDQLSDYADWLIQEERSAATAEKYRLFTNFGWKIK